MRARDVFDSFGYALAGIGHAFRTQRNFKIHTGITAGVVVAGLAAGLAAGEWAVLCVTFAMVFQAELVNTALEAIVDKTTPGIHPLAKVAKDCAAGAVLVTAIGAVGVGLAVFGPRLLKLLGWA